MYERPYEYYNKISDINVRCPYCGHTNIMPVFVDTKICHYCKHKIQNNTRDYFNYKLRKEIEKKEQEMTEDEKYYIELETMQELGMLEEGANIMELMAEHDIEKQDEEMAEIIEENEPEKELENHMVLGEYYDE